MPPKRSSSSSSSPPATPLRALQRAFERLQAAESLEALVALLPAVACELWSAPRSVLVCASDREGARVLSSHGAAPAGKHLPAGSDASQLALAAGAPVTWRAAEGPALSEAAGEASALAVPLSIANQPSVALACYREAPFGPDETEQGVLLATLACSVWSRLSFEETARLNEVIVKQAEFQNTQLREQVARAERLKADFVANMSHELRTPLNVVLGFSSLLADEAFGSLNTQQSEASEKIIDSAERLATLINDLLDFSRLQAGMFDFQFEPLDLNRLLGELIQDVERLATRKQQEVSLEVPPDLPCIEADEARLRQALMHLLDNALKFTDLRGRIGVRASVEGEAVRIEVWDTGIGIPPDAQIRLFERFYQVDSSSTRLYGGTGIGLSLVKELIEGHGGHVTVESQPGAGSTFTLTLPTKQTRHEVLVG